VTPQAKNDHLVSMPVGEGDRALFHGCNKIRMIKNLESPSVRPKPVEGGDKWG
jgi:hypothetical protein